MRITEFYGLSIDGGFLREFKVMFPWFIAVDRNGCVGVVSEESPYIRFIGRSGDDLIAPFGTEYELSYPSAIVADHFGNLVVAHKRISIFG